MMRNPTYHCALLLALLPAASALAADAPVADLPPIEVNQGVRQPSLRLDYAHRIAGSGASDDYLNLMATRDLYALLYEREQTAPFGPAGTYGMDRVAFLFGGPSRPDSGENAGYIGLGQTWVRGPQPASVVSLLVRLQLQAFPDLGPELNFSVPVSKLFGGGHSNVTREMDAEFGWRARFEHGFFRFGYRMFAVNTASRPGGWYLGLGLYY